MEAVPLPLLNELEDTDTLSSDDPLDEMALLHQFHMLSNRQPARAQCRCPRKSVVILLLAIITIATVLVVFLVFKFGLHGVRENQELRLLRFLHVSDTHLDLYYDSSVTNKEGQQCRNKYHKNNTHLAKLNSTCIFGRPDCDTSLRLLESLGKELSRISEQLKNQGEGLDFILITGDLVAHDYGLFKVDVLNSVLWSITNSTKTISDALPGVPVLICAGNNDLTIDYEPPLTNHSTFYSLLYNQLERFIFPQQSHSNLTSRAQVRSTFEFGGYYSTSITKSTTVIVLNTNYWSLSAYVLNNSITAIGDEQLNWLEEQLKLAETNKRRVIITGHIPPGIDTYNRRSHWLQNYTDAYIEFVTKHFQDVVIAQLYGHNHRDKVKILQQHQKSSNISNTAMNSFVLTCPSITPIYDNNPAFRIYTYNELGQDSLDYTQYYFDLAASNVDKKAYWLREYSFRDTYKVKLSSAGVKQVVNQILHPGSSTWLHYSRHMVASKGGVTVNERYGEFCGSRYSNVPDYTNCLERFKDAGDL